MSKKFNLSQLVSIEVADKKVSEAYVYKPEKVYRKWYGKKIVEKEGIYNVISWIYPKFMCQKQLLPNSSLGGKYMLIDDVIYQKPFIYLKFSNGDDSIQFFNNMTDAIIEADEIRLNASPKLKYYTEK